MEEPSLGREIQTVSNLMSRQLYRAVQALEVEGFTNRQGQIIHFLIIREGRGPVFQRDVEEEFSIRRPTATGILQLMEKNGLLRRETVCHDARLKRLVLTDKARALHCRIAKLITDAEGRLTLGSTPEELEVTRRVLERMRDNLSRD